MFWQYDEAVSCLILVHGPQCLRSSYPYTGSHHYVQLHMTYAVLSHLHLMYHPALTDFDSLILALHHNALTATWQKQYEVAIVVIMLC